ncbi:MAG TPA: VOC family protein [Gemmatimonadaceae bacterium]
MATTATATSTKGRFVWHELLTKDPVAAQDFYTKVIGWGTQKFEGSPGGDYTMWMDGQTPVGGVMTLPADAAAMGAPPSWLAYVEVPDVDDTIALAEKLGGKVLVPVQDIPDVGRFAVLQDPQGGVFAILTSAMPLGPEEDPSPRTFSWHELATSDQQGAISFYEQLFGWTKKGEFDMGPMGIYHMYGRDRFTYGGMMTKPPEVPNSYWLHYIQVEDTADAAAGRATALGATPVVGPMEVPGGDRVAVLTDPQGAYFAVHSKGAK